MPHLPTIQCRTKDEGDGYQQSVPLAYSSMAPETISIFGKTTCSARKVATTLCDFGEFGSQTTLFAPRLRSVGNYTLLMYRRVVIHKIIKWFWSPLIAKAGQISPVCILKISPAIAIDEQVLYCECCFLHWVYLDIMITLMFWYTRLEKTRCSCFVSIVLIWNELRKNC